MFVICSSLKVLPRLTYVAALPGEMFGAFLTHSGQRLGFYGAILYINPFSNPALLS